MTTDTAKQIGGRRALVNYIIATVFWELVLIVQTMNEDPVNGLRILFYMQINVFTIVCLLILLGATYLCGRRAGNEIFNNSDGHLKTGLKYALLTSMVVLVPALPVFYFASGGSDTILWPVLLITGTMTTVWLATARQISRRIASEMEK